MHVNQFSDEAAQIYELAKKRAMNYTSSPQHAVKMARMMVRAEIEFRHWDYIHHLRHAGGNAGTTYNCVTDIIEGREKAS